MRRLCIIILIGICSVSAQNQAPFIVSFISPSDNSANIITVPFRLADAENDICTVSVVYSTDNGSSWLPATVTNRVFQSNNSEYDTIYWKSYDDLGISNFAAVQLKLTPYDANTNTGTPVTTKAFSLANFTLYNFAALFPRTRIDSVAFTADSIITGSCTCVYRYTAANSNPTKCNAVYSLDNGTYWLPGTSTITSGHTASKKDTIVWNTAATLSGFAGSNVLFKIAAKDNVTGRKGLATPTGKLSIDNEAPSFFWACGAADTNIVLLDFPRDIDSVKILDTRRYTMNFGRKITAVHTNNNSGSLITLTYSVKAGPEQPDNQEDLVVLYYSKLNSWVKVRTIEPDDAPNWTTFTDSIVDVNAFHPKFKVRFTQAGNSGINFDNYYLDDVVIKKDNSILFNDSIPSSVISPIKWTTIIDVATTTDYFTSSPYSLKFNGSASRTIESADILTGNSGNLGGCRFYAETDLPLLPGVPYKLTIDTLFDLTGNYTTSAVYDTFACRSDAFNPSMVLADPQKVLSGREKIYYKLSDPNLDVLTISGVEYKTRGGQWQKATVSGYLDNIQSSNYNRYFYWDTKADLPDRHCYSVSLRARVSDTTLEGTFDMLRDLEINNNHVPAISLTKVSPLYSDTTVINYTITDTEKDTVNLDVFFSSDNATWYPANTTGATQNILPAGYTGSFKWMTRNDVKPPKYEITGTLFCKVIPKDYAFGKAQTLQVPYNSSTLPIVKLGTVSGEQSDTVCISYILYDKDNSTISLACQYSLDNGSTWHNATTANSLSGITSAQYKGAIKWLSWIDASGVDSFSVFFRAIPYDPGMGTAATTNKFHLDNNKIPVAYITSAPSGTQMDEVPVKIALSDTEFDEIRSMKFYYRKHLSSTWNTAHMKESLYNIDSSEYAGKILTFTWRGDYDINNYADTIWMRFRAKDNDYGQYSNEVGFYYSDKGPELTVYPIVDEQSGDVPVRFRINSNTLDSITVTGYYDTESSFWEKGSFKGVMKYGPYNDSGYIEWKSRDDLGNTDYNKVRIRLRAFSHKTGNYAYSNYFVLDNNRAPTAKLLPNPVVTIDKVYFKSVYTDFEFDPLRVSFQYFRAGNSTWRNATLEKAIGILEKSEYDNDTISIVWKSKVDVPGFTDTMLVRLAAFDTDTSAWDTIGFHLGQMAPDLYLNYMLTEVSDSVYFPYRVIYDGKDTVRMAVEYSADNISWHTATLTGPVMYAWPAAKQDTLIWLSHIDLPHVDIDKVRLRIKPTAKFEGVWKKSLPFHLDNNLPPRITFTPATKNLEDSILPISAEIKFAVADSESDTISNWCEYRVFPQTVFHPFTLPDEITTVTAEQYEVSTFGFNYTFDDYGDSIGAEFIIFCADNDISNFDTVSLLFRRFLGDFNCNGYVDLADLDTFVIAWHTGDYSKNTGPVQGTFPNVTVLEDSIFNLEDLSAFVISWNYSRKCMLSHDVYASRERDIILNADKKLFRTVNATPFDQTLISAQEKSSHTYIITITLPEDIPLSEGILLSFPQDITIESVAGLSGDFSTNGFNNTNNEVLLYTASPLNLHIPGQRTAIITIRVSNPEKMPVFDLHYRARYSENRVTHKTATIPLDDIITDSEGSVTITVVPNPFTPDESMLPAGVQRRTAKQNGTLILVKKPNNIPSCNRYFTKGSVSIFDMPGNTVQNNLPLSYDSNGNLYFAWYGYNSSGRIVGNGTYKAVITTQDVVNGKAVYEILIGVKR